MVGGERSGVAFGMHDDGLYEPRHQASGFRHQQASGRSLPAGNATHHVTRLVFYEKALDALEQEFVDSGGARSTTSAGCQVGAGLGAEGVSDGE